MLKSNNHGKNAMVQSESLIDVVVEVPREREGNEENGYFSDIDEDDAYETYNYELSDIDDDREFDRYISYNTLINYNAIF